MDTYYHGHAATVRQLTHQDLVSLYSQAAVKRVLQAYRPGFSEEARDPHTVAARLGWLSRMQPPPELEALVVYRRSQIPIGFVCLSSLDPANAKAELSLAFFRGRGSRAALEALHWALEAAFYRSQLRKLVCYVLPVNQPAQRLLDALGASQEAVLRAEVRQPDGGFTDLVRYCLFRSDWESSAARQRLRSLAPLLEDSQPPRKA